jgi:hypothetical protein
MKRKCIILECKCTKPYSPTDFGTTATLCATCENNRKLAEAKDRSRRDRKKSLRGARGAINLEKIAEQFEKDN